MAEIHLLDDIAEELLKAKLRRKRLWISIAGMIFQIGFSAFLFLSYHLWFHGFYLPWLGLIMYPLFVWLQWRYRYPGSTGSEKKAQGV